ncbi:centromere-associated protein E isoform X2 [Pogona vitticeps]
MAEEGGVTVCVRVRPLIARENEDFDDKVQISWKSEDCTVSQIDGAKSFVFDRVFHSDDSTAEVYQGVAAPIIKSAVQGYNGTIFAYGQTASGKTYTMLGTKETPGILPMAIHDVFSTICKIPEREFLLRISYMEIHNETIQDLLCSNIRKKKPLVVREDINRTIYVEDLNEEVVVSPEQVLSWLQKGEKNRHYGETKMNERSSRSHTIFRMIIESKEKTDTSSSSCEGAVMVSHLNLVDLAGSERASQTGAEGIRLKEGCNINRSLFILGQVIKKLCEDQSGGFINYRDSKLTRILQNSLGGNAKTVIICTVTPVSLEETLSTLQFASTAKKMKNTPKVNEVLDDDALLKRYRKEIEDLKRQLEEVSSLSHTKDQLAQLLEEKNSLQKEQQDRIRALTEMLVTASSFAREQELKTRRKRRVTWAPGAISQDGGLCFLEDLPGKSKRYKASFASLTEMEESVSSEFSEYDDQGMIASIAQSAEEWVPGSEINFIHKDFAESVQLCETLVEERDNAVTEQQVMIIKLENLQLENKQLRCELTELREKMSTEEFVALENETAKEHEMQLMHEISNLKAIIANAEVYNQDIQEEIKLKDAQLKEQEDKMKMLENNVTELKNLVEELKAESGKKDQSFSITSNKGLDEMQQLKQSLSDAEAVALDAKKESSFLRSENLALKEKMTQLSDTCNQMEKDLKCCRSQLDAGKVTYKKMQSDLQKELQFYVQENAKLVSLVEEKAPKDLLSSVELQRKVEELKNELNKAVEENTTLRKDATVFSEDSSGQDLEILRKEILEKSEMITSLISEKESLLSQVAEKEILLQEMTDALKSKQNFADADEIKKDADFQELKHQYDELGQKLLTTSEESKQMKNQVDLLSDENLKLNTAIHDLTQELSCKIEELQKKDLEQEKFLSLKEQLDEAHQKLSEMEQVKDQLQALESKMEAEEAEKQAIAQRLHKGEEEIGVLTQERDELKQNQEVLEQERDQIKAEMQETVSKNIAIQEELRSTHTSLKQYQNHIKELEDAVAERDTQISIVKESLGNAIDEQKQQILKLTEDLELITMEKNVTKADASQVENNELQSLKEQILFLEEEKTTLQQVIEDLLVEKNRCLERHQLLAREGQKPETEATVSVLKEELQQALKKISEMEELKQQLKTTESVMEAEITDNMTLVQQLHQNEDTLRALSQERDHLRASQEVLKMEMDQLKEELQATQSTLSLKIQELQGKEKEREELLEMKQQLCESRLKQDAVDQLEEELKAEKMAKSEMAQRLCDSEREREALIQEKDDLKQKLDALQTESKAFRELEEETSLKIQKLLEESCDLKKQLELQEEQSQQDEEKLNELRELKATVESKMAATELEKTELAERFHATVARMKSVTQENESLKTTLQTLQNEKGNLIETIHRLGETVERTVTTNLELQEQLRQANNSMKEMEESREITDETSLTSKVHKTLTQMFEDTVTELERLRAQAKTSEEQVNRLKDQIGERDQLHQQLEAKYIEEKEQLREKLNEALSLHMGEKDQLLAELKDQTERVQQLMKESTFLQKERNELQQAIQNIRAENDQLQTRLLENTAKFSEINVKVEEQDNIENLEQKVLKIKEALKQFPVLENRSECFKNISLQIKCELDNQKSLLAKVLADLSPLQASNVKRLHMEHESISNGLHSLLNKVQFLFTRLCKKKAEYYTNITTCTAELLDDRRKQHELQTQFRCLQKLHLEPQGVVPQERNIAELSQCLDMHTEQILKDISELEEELRIIEERVQKMESDGQEAKQQLAHCLVNFDAQDFEAGIKQYNETLMPVGRFLKTKTQEYIQARSEVESRNAEYCKETEVALKACREQTKELLLELNTLQEKQKSHVANVVLEEENYTLQNKLQVAEQDVKNLKRKIQELENGATEAERNRQQMEKRMYALQAELTVRTSKSEVAKLQAALEEKENCLKSALAGKETLKAQLDKGAELYKEEIEDLKTQLVKADMARMKQSKYFDQEMANAKALAEHREDQLRKLKEELRRVQQEQDVTVIASKDLPQTSLPITCGGGSGIVQNTQVLVLKTEHAKLEKKYSQLKKEYDLVLANELTLKEEIKKWKERALKRREQASRSTDEEQRLKSPRRTAPAAFPEVPCSPSKEQSLRPVLPLDTPPATALNWPTFFDDPRQGNSTDRRPTRAESSENTLKHWIATANKDDAKNCKTQ